MEISQPGRTFERGEFDCCAVRPMGSAAGRAAFTSAQVMEPFSSVLEDSRYLLLRGGCEAINVSSVVSEDFCQEPRAAFGLIGPDLDQAGARHVVVTFADFVCEAQESRQFPVIRSQLKKHLLWR